MHGWGFGYYFYKTGFRVTADAAAVEIVDASEACDALAKRGKSKRERTSEKKRYFVLYGLRCASVPDKKHKQNTSSSYLPHGGGS